MIVRHMLISALLVLIPVLASARLLGTAGATFSFAEKDALTEIGEKAKKVDWERAFARLRKQGEHPMPLNVPKLPRVAEARSRQVDMTYTLDVDIPDPRHVDQILYPKGFAFNVLQYMTLPGAVIFVDASDRLQRNWLKTYPVARDPLAMILLTGGDFGAVEKLLDRPVSYADSIMVTRFGIEAVPAVAKQNGETLTVEEVCLEQKTVSQR